MDHDPAGEKQRPPAGEDLVQQPRGTADYSQPALPTGRRAEQDLTPEQVDQFSRYYRASVAKLVAYLMAACGASPQEAAECVQDTLSELARRWTKVTLPMAWCRTVARRKYYARLYSAVASFDQLPADGAPLLISDSPKIDDL